MAPKAVAQGSRIQRPQASGSRQSALAVDSTIAQRSWWAGIGIVWRLSQTRSPNVAFDVQWSVDAGCGNARGLSTVQMASAASAAHVQWPSGPRRWITSENSASSGTRVQNDHGLAWRAQVLSVIDIKAANGFCRIIDSL